MTITWTFSAPTPETVNERQLTAQASTGLGSELGARLVTPVYISLDPTGATIDWPGNVAVNGEFPDFSAIANVLTDETGQLTFDLVVHRGPTDVYICLVNSDNTVKVSPKIHFALDPPRFNSVHANGNAGIEIQTLDGFRIDRFRLEISGFADLDIYNPNGPHNGLNDVDTVIPGWNVNMSGDDMVIDNAVKLNAVTCLAIHAYDVDGVEIAADDFEDFTTNPA